MKYILLFKRKVVRLDYITDIMNIPHALLLVKSPRGEVNGNVTNVISYAQSNIEAEALTVTGLLSNKHFTNSKFDS